MIYFLCITVIANIFFLFFNYKIAVLLNLFDKPDNERKFHKLPVPLTGGIIVFLNIIFLVFFLIIEKSYLNKLNIFYDFYDFLIFFISIIIFFLLGFFDDKYKISSIKRLFFMIPVLLIVVTYSNDLLIKEVRLSFIENFFYLYNITSIVWTIVCFLLFINALNMFDGINCQVGIYSLFICFIFLSNNYFVLFFIVILISLGFFLLMNQKNKAFLGDSGTYLLAFIFAYFFVKLYNQNAFIYADQIVIFMLVPGLDLIRLFVLRIFKGKSPFAADRNHLHHIVLSRNSLLVSNVKILSLIIAPSILSFYFGYIYQFIILQVLFYFFLVFKS